MKKVFLLLFTFALAAGLGKVLWNTWETTQYFQAKGREATVKIGKKYNASRWTAPIPIKKIHAYTAVMEPDHEVLLETDQELNENQEYFLRFFFRDEATEARKMSILPLVNSIRLKSEADGTPVKLADTDLFDRAVTKAMGPMGEGYYERPKPVAEAAPSHERPTVPFLLAGAQDGTLEIMWNNSTIGERLIVLFWIIGINLFLLNAWSTPFNPNRRAGHERKDFVHPSMRRIDVEKPAAPSAKIAYTPKPEEPDYKPTPPPVAPTPVSAPDAPPRVTIPAPASTKLTPAQPTSVSSSTTAPFVPVAGAEEPTLKLKRKPKIEPEK